jgi:gluconokinase
VSAAEHDTSGAASRTTTVVVMGVSGTGKTTVAEQLVKQLGWPFAEGDTFHPAASVAKMHAGIPLDDDDRWPWLQALADWIGAREAAGENAVVTCSSLKRSYRDLLRTGHPSVWFAHVDTSPDVLRERVTQRAGHYMPPSLLDSQLATLERLEPEEPGLTITGEGRPDAVAARVLEVLAAERGSVDPGLASDACPPAGSSPVQPPSSVHRCSRAAGSSATTSPSRRGPHRRRWC